MICGGVLPESGEPMLISEGRRGHDDRKLVKSIIAELNKYDLLIGFNSLNFDVRYLNSRALHWNLAPLAGKLHCDLYRIAKPVFKTTKYTSCSLKTITDLLHIKGAGGEEKGRVEPEIWQRAALSGDKYAIGQIAEHCRKDIMILPPLFRRLRYAIRSISTV